MRIRACLGSALMVFTVAGAAPAAAVDSPTYGYGNARLGGAPGTIGLGAIQARGLHAVWRAQLPGAIDGQPIVVNGVRSRHGSRNVVLVGTEHGIVAELDLRGHLIWERHLGTRHISPSCQASPDGEFGVTGAMAADRRAGRVYAVDAIGRAWALSLRNGHTITGWPVFVHPPGDEFDWGALAVSHGWLYVPIASLCDRGRYYGGIDAVSISNPRIRHKWVTTGGTKAFAGGIWGWGGEAIDKRTGHVFVATGNSIGTSNEAEGGAERVVELSRTLKELKRNYPLRGPFGRFDRDFGTAPLLIRRPGCPTQLIAINKDGFLYRYNAGQIAAGPRQSIQIASGSSLFIPLYGMPAYDPATHRLVLTSPSPGPSGRRMGIQSYILNRHCRLVYSWQHGFDPPSAGSPPTIAQGVLYIGSGRNGILRAYRLSNGQELSHQSLGSTIFAAPIAADGAVFAGDWAGHLWSFRG